jgi:enolase-phosphatase E1
MSDHAESIPVTGILLDIEGTTSSIDFVYDVMFPYARKNFAAYLQTHFSTDGVQSALPLLAADLKFDSVDAMFAQCVDDADDTRVDFVHQALIGLMDDDVKSTGLKKLQGLVWESGFASGEMVAHLYDDVAPAIEAWKAAGIDVRIYSSGSIYAQKLFFGHSVAGDLLPHFSGHYDTTIGHKQESESYSKIAADWIEASQILFISDVAAELDAAQTAGMQTMLSLRPGNKEVPNKDAYSAIDSFEQVSQKLSG